MDLLRSYGEYDIYSDEDQPSSPQLLLLPAKSSSPSLDANPTLALPIHPTQHSVVSTPRMCGGNESQLRRTMETEVRGGTSHLIIPNRERQPTPLVGWRGLFWDLDGIKPEGKVLWRLWISLGERCRKVFNAYYTIDEYEVQECAGAGAGAGAGGAGTGTGAGAGAGTGTGAGTGEVDQDVDDDDDEEEEVDQDVEDEDDEVDQDVEDEKSGVHLYSTSAMDITCCPTKKKFNYLLLDLLKFIRAYPPPATIVFVSSNAGFAPFLRMVKENGYLVLVISESECASSAFQDVGLTLCDWIPAIHGEGFFPSE